MSDYHRQHSVNTRIIRIFNTYGPNMDPKDGRVVSNCIMQALRNEDITIYGDGTQTRSFCYVSDLVEGMIRMMNNDKNFVDPVKRKPDITLAKQNLNWLPKVDINEGLSKTVEYFKQL